jgi:cytochrome P450
MGTYQPLDPAFLERPWDSYRWLRDEHPVWRDPASGAYLISRFDDVWETAANWQQFPSEPKAGSRQHFASMDPPQHDRHRSKVARLFTPRAMSRLRADIAARCLNLIRPLCGQRSFDFVTGFSELLPNMVIGALVGVPAQVEEEFRSRALALSEAAGTAESDTAMTALEDTARRIVDGTHPPVPGGIAARLLADSTDPLVLGEMVGLVTNLVLAGSDTVTHLLGSAVVLLAGNPALRSRLQREPELIAPAVEELLRLESPAQLLFRHTEQALTVRGVDIPAGSDVRLMWGAANRDEREFAEPDEFQLERRATRHLAFGHGLHFCVGASLARLQAQEAIAALLPVLEEYRIDPEATERLPSLVFRGYRHLTLIREQ